MKKIAKMLLCSMLLVLLAGCAGSGKYEVNVEKLKDSSGEYRFEELVWGSSVAEAEALLGTTLKTMGTVENREVFHAEDAFVWNDVKGTVSCEFADGALDTVSIMLRPAGDEQEQLWSSLQKELFELYGEVESQVRNSVSEALNLTTEGETYLWESMGERCTALSLSKLSTEGEFKYIDISVYVIPEGK